MTELTLWGIGAQGLAYPNRAYFAIQRALPRLTRRRPPGSELSEMLESRLLLADVSFAPQTTLAAGTNPAFVTSGDFNADGKPDLAEANYGASTVGILLGNGNGTFQTRVDYSTGSGPRSVATGDFNGDGRTDLAIGNQGAGTVSILLGNSNGTFQPKVD